MDKSKKILAVVVTVVMALLLTAMVLLLCLLPNKDNNNTAGSDDDTTQTPGDSSDTNDGVSGADSSDTTGNPSDTQNTVGDYTYNTPSAITLASDKTELAPGDKFTVSIEIATNRTEMYWQGISLVIGPMLDVTTVSPEIASNFELDEEEPYTLSDFIAADWINNSGDRFDSAYSGFLISLSSSGTKTPATEKIKITLNFKVKETATEVDNFLFGVANIGINMIGYVSEDNKTKMFDIATGDSVNKTNGANNVTEKEKGITTQKLTMSIKAK
ncbi:MAG: hypothetical protein ACI4QN_02260 [Candidatus Coproplasma sp.]